MTSILGTKRYFPYTTGIHISYTLELTVAPGKTVVVNLTHPGSQYTAVDKSNLGNTYLTFTNTAQVQTVVVYLTSADNITTGTTISHTVASSDTAVYTVGQTFQDMVIQDRVSLTLDPNNVTIKYTGFDTTDDLVGVFTSGPLINNEYYIVPEKNIIKFS